MRMQSLLSIQCLVKIEYQIFWCRKILVSSTGLLVDWLKVSRYLSNFVWLLKKILAWMLYFIYLFCEVFKNLPCIYLYLFLCLARYIVQIWLMLFWTWKSRKICHWFVFMKRWIFLFNTAFWLPLLWWIPNMKR